jgi:hypothetical protein
VAQRAGCVSGGGRIVSHLQGTVETCSRLTGQILWDPKRPPRARLYSCNLVPPPPATDWKTDDVSCSAADWSSTDRCNADQVGFLDQQKQDQVSEASFELVKIGKLTDTDRTCQTVRATLPAIPR